MQIVKQALRAVVPPWLSICVIALIWGLTMQTLPGLMEGANFYPTSWAANLAHYDPHAYLLVAEQGYGAEGRDFQSSVRFPLFPFFARALTQLTGIDTYESLFWISKAGLLVGLIGLWLLVMLLHNAEQASRATLYMLFPLLGSGYTWLMSYPEALHLAFWAFGFYLLYRRQDYLCGLVTVLSMWTRPQSVVILPVFALVLLGDAIREHGVRGLLDWHLWRRGLLVCGLPLLAYSAWILHISRLTELPLSPIAGQQTYGRSMFLLPWERVISRLTQPFQANAVPFRWETIFEYYQLMFIVIALLVLALLALRRRIPWSLVLFSILSIAPGLSTGIFGVGRYALLTWIPLAAIYVIPKRYDSVVIPVGAALSFLALVVVGLTKGLTP